MTPSTVTMKTCITTLRWEPFPCIPLRIPMATSRCQISITHMFTSVASQSMEPLMFRWCNTPWQAIWPTLTVWPLTLVKAHVAIKTTAKWLSLLSAICQLTMASRQVTWTELSHLESISSLLGEGILREAEKRILLKRIAQLFLTNHPTIFTEVKGKSRQPWSRASLKWFSTMESRLRQQLWIWGSTAGLSKARERWNPIYSLHPHNSVQCRKIDQSIQMSSPWDSTALPCLVRSQSVSKTTLTSWPSLQRSRKLQRWSSLPPSSGRKNDHRDR